ncbi:NUDIX domain-containing protein, partial [Vreelandella aquamarina]|uniref:NUDIX domain-containing protein n=1 Tax=Vreelandella aquamarina TaxID=77097 RepID=UPI001D192706
MTPDTQAARQVQLLVVDTQGRLLLKREASPPHWTLLGSALAHDEDYPAAAIRLLFEEAGLTCPLGPLLRQRAHTAKAGQTGEERFFLVRCPDTPSVSPLFHRWCCNCLNSVENFSAIN